MRFLSTQVPKTNAKVFSSSQQIDLNSKNRVNKNPKQGKEPNTNGDTTERIPDDPNSKKGFKESARNDNAKVATRTINPEIITPPKQKKEDNGNSGQESKNEKSSMWRIFCNNITMGSLFGGSIGMWILTPYYNILYEERRAEQHILEQFKKDRSHLRFLLRKSNSVVVGESGIGKTTKIWRYADELRKGELPVLYVSPRRTLTLFEDFMKQIFGTSDERSSSRQSKTTNIWDIR